MVRRTGREHQVPAKIVPTHWRWGNAQAFVRLKKTLAESAVEAGVSIPW